MRSSEKTLLHSVEVQFFLVQSRQSLEQSSKWCGISSAGECFQGKIGQALEGVLRYAGPWGFYSTLTGLSGLMSRAEDQGKGKDLAQNHCVICRVFCLHLYGSCKSMTMMMMTMMIMKISPSETSDDGRQRQGSVSRGLCGSYLTSEINTQILQFMLAVLTQRWSSWSCHFRSVYTGWSDVTYLWSQCDRHFV